MLGRGATLAAMGFDRAWVSGIAPALLATLALASTEAQAGSRTTVAVGALVVAGGTCKFTAASTGDTGLQVPFSCMRGTTHKSVRYAVGRAADPLVRDAERSMSVARVREPAGAAAPESVVVTITP